MQVKTILSTIFMLIWGVFGNVHAADIPRIAYMGPVVEYVSPTEYADMKACGFTHSINIYNTLASAKTDLARAYKAGLGLYIHTPQVVQTPAKAASILAGQKGLAGFFLADEPSYSDLLTYKKHIREIAKVDRDLSCVVNLHPYYDKKQFRSIGAKTYSQYLQVASNIGLPQISFDYYPVTRNGLRDGWFRNLSEVRNLCRKRNVPFWGFILSVPHGEYPQPTQASLRLQAYVNLIYGAKALVYFTYKTPYDKRYDFHDAPLNAEGQKTPTYSLVKNLNLELASISPLFLNATITRIGHLVHIPESESKSIRPKQLSSLVVTGKKGAVVSEFISNSHHYLAVVNKDYIATMQLTLKARTRSVCYITKKLQRSQLADSYTIQPGDIALFQLD